MKKKKVKTVCLEIGKKGEKFMIRKIIEKTKNGKILSEDIYFSRGPLKINQNIDLLAKEDNCIITGIKPTGRSGVTFKVKAGSFKFEVVFIKKNSFV